MGTTALVTLICLAIVALVSVAIGSLGVRMARTTSDFLVASRTVGPTANAAAISGEYLSAASFLGVAGLILKDGPDALWYPVGFTAGYLGLLLFVAAPLRRSGAYTVPDFADVRLRSVPLRRVCTLVVIVIGWLYVLPQLQGAGLTVATVTSLPGWSGVVSAAIVVIASVIFGGMRSITFVQAFQYWLKLTALAVPVIFLVLHFAGDRRSFDRPAPPEFPADTTVSVQTDVTLEVSQPVSFSARGVLDGRQENGLVRWQQGTTHTVQQGASLTFSAGTSVPVVAGTPQTDASWLTPLSGKREYQLLEIYSLILATFLGTLGLPHVLARFYTNSDGRAARRTTVVVLAMLGAFYLMPTLLGALSRLYVPQLLVSGQTDAAILRLPAAALGENWLATALGGLVAAGAWAAFLSTSSGLVVSVAGVLFTDVLKGRLRSFTLATLIAGTVPMVLALFASRLDLAQTVVLAFAVAASTFCPLLVLGIWWRGLTDRGAIAGVAVGGALSAVSVMLSLFDVGATGWVSALLIRPAAISAPAAFLTMIVVSKLTRKRVLSDVDHVLLRLHAPERLGLSRDRLPDAAG
ncbi:MAG: cation acetate symporter [Pseudonocardiales bacterium]|nr:cation acetate symporter [Pseudonocardiales bacterium]